MEDKDSQVQWNTKPNSERSNPQRRREQLILTQERRLLPLITPRTKWHEDYHPQEYLRSNLATCLFASTANGARDLNLPIPANFEQQVIANPQLRRYFHPQTGGFQIELPGAETCYQQTVQTLIPGLVIELSRQLPLTTLISRLNDQKPAVVFVGNGSHAIELNAAWIQGEHVAFTLVDPLGNAKIQQKTLAELGQQGLVLYPGEGTIFAVTLDHQPPSQPRPVRWR